MTERDDLERLRAEGYRRVDELILQRVRDEGYRHVDAWIDARRDLDEAEASGHPDEITAAEEAVYEAAIVAAELVLGDVLRDRMWRENEPYDDLGRDDKTRQRRALAMLRQFLIDTVPLGLPEVSDPFIKAAWRTLGRS